jgi:predicted MFS family arabinose efflux permease
LKILDASTKNRRLTYESPAPDTGLSVAPDAPDRSSVEPRGEGSSPWNLYTARERRRFLVVLSLMAVSNNFDYYILGVVLEPIKQEFHVSDAQLGLLSGFCFAMCFAFASFPFARWSDRGDRRAALSFALAGWSVMTLFFGVATSFWQLVLARFGVGAMEPGATPAGQSLIADYYPPERRGAALAIMISGSSVGCLLALALGGYMAATLGWRHAFLIAGGVGIVLALITRLVLHEPRLRLGFPSAKRQAETFKQAIKRLAGKPSFVYTLLGMSVFYVFSLGVMTFLPSFMMRSLHASLERLSLTWGIAVSAAGFFGTLAGGWLADRLSRVDIRWYAWLSMIGCVVGALLYWWALSTNDLWVFVAVEFVAELVLQTGIFAAWPAIHAVCGNPRRATALAIVSFAFVLVGGGIGPLAAGAISDALSARFGTQSLRYSLDIMTLTLLPAAILFYCSARAMTHDQEE